MNRKYISSQEPKVHIRLASSSLSVPSEVHGAVALAGNGEVIDVGELVEQTLPVLRLFGGKKGDQRFLVSLDADKKSPHWAGWGKRVRLESAAQCLARHTVAIVIEAGIAALFQVESRLFAG